MQTIQLLNVSIDNLSLDELLTQLAQQGGVVFTPNVDHLMKLQHDAEFERIYQSATYRVCDSQILMYAAKLMGEPLKEKISGSDLLPAFYTRYAHCEDTTIFLLGAAEGVARTAQTNINQKVGRQMVVDAYSPSFGFENDEQECQYILERINESGATVLAVGVGSPKQEKWIAKYKDQLPNVKVFLAIGASIDFEAGEKPRAPQWMSELGLEWAYRLASEPQRLWKRYLLEDLPIFGLLLQQKLGLYQAPLAAPMQAPMQAPLATQAG